MGADQVHSILVIEVHHPVAMSKWEDPDPP